jgi:hypothetical protein
MINTPSMKFEKTDKFKRGQYAKVDALDGTRIYKVLRVITPTQLTLIRVGTVGYREFEMSKGGYMRYVDTAMYGKTNYIPCKVTFSWSD